MLNEVNITYLTTDYTFGLDLGHQPNFVGEVSTHSPLSFLMAQFFANHVREYTIKACLALFMAHRRTSAFPLYARQENRASAKYRIIRYWNSGRNRSRNELWKIGFGNGPLSTKYGGNGLWENSTIIVLFAVSYDTFPSRLFLHARH